MKALIIFVFTVSMVMNASAYFGSRGTARRNCGWSSSIFAHGQSFTFEAVDTPKEEDVECQSHISNGNVYDPTYYEIEFSRQYAKCEGEEIILESQLSSGGNRLNLCGKQYMKFVVHVPVQLTYKAPVNVEGHAFKMVFKQVADPCLPTLEAKMNSPRVLLSPLYLQRELGYDSNSVYNAMDCQTRVTVPENKVLFLQVLQNPARSPNHCNGSLVISESSALESVQLCGKGLASIAVEPLNYRTGVNFRFKRHYQTIFNGFQVEYSAIRKEAIYCRNQTVISVPVTSEAAYIQIQVHLDVVRNGYCEVHLTSNSKSTISLTNLLELNNYLNADFATGSNAFSYGCGSSTFKHLLAPPNKNVKIKLCHGGQSYLPYYKVETVAFIAKAGVNDEFPQDFYAADNIPSDIWIPRKLTRPSEPLTFRIHAPFNTSCLTFEPKQADDPVLALVARMFAGPDSENYFEFTRDCKYQTWDQERILNVTSHVVTVVMNRYISRSFWLSFQVLTGMDCPLKETIPNFKQNDDKSLQPPNADGWKANTQCKWLLFAAFYRMLKYKGKILASDPNLVSLTVTNASTNQEITRFNPSAPGAWRFAATSINVNVKVTKPLAASESFSFVYEGQMLLDLETCDHQTKILDMPQTVYTPNYPNYSFRSTSCSWKILLPESFATVKFALSSLIYVSCNSQSAIHITYVEYATGLRRTVDPYLLCEVTGYEQTSYGDVMIDFSTDASNQVPGFYFNFSYFDHGGSGPDGNGGDSGEDSSCPTYPVELDATINKQFLSSMNYPYNYPNNLNCNWRITTDVNSRIEISFIYLNLEEQHDCDFDGIQIYDGNDDNAPSLAKLCSPVSDDLMTFVSSSSAMFIHFYSDESQNRKGFHLSYKKVDSTVAGCNSSPVSVKVSESAPVLLKSPNYPYSYYSNADCYWRVQSSLDVVEIKVEVLDLESQAMCLYDYLQIYDGWSTYSETIGKLCTPNQAKVYTSSNDVIFIHFHSDSYGHGRGFLLSLRSRLRESTGEPPDSSKQSQSTGVIIGGSVSAVLAFFFLIFIIFLYMVRRKRHLQMQRQRRRAHHSTSVNYNNNNNNNNRPSSVFVINPLIVNAEPPPYPGVSNPTYISDTEAPYSVLDAPPNYCDVANTYNHIEPPAYSPDMPGQTPQSNERPNSLDVQNSANLSDEPITAGNLNIYNVAHPDYAELEDTPPDYAVAGPLSNGQVEPPPAYETREKPKNTQKNSHLGSF